MGQEFGLYGIFGFPLAHTLSPRMQEAAFRALGLKAFYLPFEVTRKDFLRLMKRRADLILDGFNVTVPYKETALHYLDRVSPSAEAVGAVNTVVRKGRYWVGFNTDGLGFITSLEKEGRFRPRGRRVLILGAGGSARAIAYALAERGAKSIAIANRTPSRAQKIVVDYQRLFPKVAWFVGDGPGGDSRHSRPGPLGTVPDLVVNATSVGLKREDPSLISPAKFPKKTLFFDLIYNPAETRFLALARRSGHPTLNGLGMLLYQGAEAFRLWTGKHAPLGVMKKAIEA